MRVLYLASNGVGLNVNKNNVTFVYNDVVDQENVDIVGDMMEVDLSDYDFLIATPPCNYWSRANYRRETSVYAQETKHLLPGIIKKFYKTGKPYIVENVINKRLMRRKFDEELIKLIDDGKINYYEVGRHSYFTNIQLEKEFIDKLQSLQVKEDVQNTSQKKRQGGYNVNIVFEKIIEELLQ